MMQQTSEVRVPTERGGALVTIRRRRVFGGDGRVEVTETVFCPPRDASVPLAACRACECCDALSLDRSGRTPSTLRCSEARPTPHTVPRRARLVHEARTPAGELMATDAVCLREDVDAATAAAMLQARGLAALPVVDANARPIGILSCEDLLRAEDESEKELPDRDGREIRHRGLHVEPQRRTVKDVMTPIAIGLPERAPLALAAALLASEAIPLLPLTGHGGEVVGSLSSVHIARWLAQRSGCVFGAHDVCTR
jgi:CBS domain-containing protein